MLTLYRPSLYDAPRAASYAGRSIDTKPLDAENGAMYSEIDTGRIYRFDAENKIWIEQEGTPVGPSITVESITITENGTTTAPSGKAYSSVTVNVPGATEPYMEETYDANDNLTNVKMVGYTKVRDSMFSGCSNLTMVEMPNTITDIGNNAFYNCGKLALTSLPSGLKNIGDNAFQRCLALAITFLPDGLETIGGKAFYMNPKLSFTQIPASVKTIGALAFSYDNFTSITFLGTPTSISNDAFSSCDKLATINVPWVKGAVSGAPWGSSATVHYNYTGA